MKAEVPVSPFISHFLQLPEGRIHYIDEGKGEVILFSHGTPEWSFAYRHLIRALSKKFRCIAIDHFGFGLSDKPLNADYTIPRQAQRFQLFVEKLELKNINLVANDFGIGIALSYAIHHPENINKISISNGWMWSLKNDPHFAKPARLLQGWLGKFLYKDLNFSVNVMMPQAYGDKKKLTKEIHYQYKLPFSSKKERTAPLAYARELINASDWWESNWTQLDRIVDNPFLIFWGMKDKFVRPAELEKWTARLKNCALIQLPSCGHFVHEEEPQRVSDELMRFF